MKFSRLIPSMLFSCATLLASAQLSAQADSEGVTWNLNDIYPSIESWEQAYSDVETLMHSIAARHKGQLTDSAERLYEGLDHISSGYRELIRVYVFASLRRDVDQRDSAEQARHGRVLQLYSNWEEATSWIRPEIIAAGEDTIRSYLAQEPRLARFEFMLENMLRMAPHVLDEAGEALLAQASLVLAAPQQIYENYANADIPWPTITLSDGREVELTQSGYSRWRAAENREDRKQVFDSFWRTWKQYENGMGSTLATKVQGNVFSARARNFSTAIQQNLFDDGLPAEIYSQLVNQVNDALPLFHRYLGLRGRILGIDDLRYYDIYPPLVDANTGTFNLERSQELTFAALQPLGQEYLDMLAHGLSQQWMHSHPQPGKRSGAYMNGSIYDVHPYILLNHTEDFNAMSTFAHEWGHAVHSMLANENNPFETARYSTFTAEIASTINEILLEEYMIEHAETTEEKLFYLGSALEGLRGTLFRQTMFAEFELEIHQRAERGDPLTGPELTAIYGELLKRYHGHDEQVLTIDDEYTVEWAYIPHFYYDFYVFQYATSVTGAAWFAEKFLDGDAGARDALLNVLKAGGSAHPHDILMNEAGLDMTQSEAYAPVMRRMESLMDRIEALLDEE